eukprot:3962077-Prymnesium_polylepis.2
MSRVLVCDLGVKKKEKKYPVESSESWYAVRRGVLHSANLPPISAWPPRPTVPLESLFELHPRAHSVLLTQPAAAAGALYHSLTAGPVGPAPCRPRLSTARLAPRIDSLTTLHGQCSWNGCGRNESSRRPDARLHQLHSSSSARRSRCSQA